MIEFVLSLILAGFAVVIGTLLLFAVFGIAIGLFVAGWREAFKRDPPTSAVVIVGIVFIVLTFVAQQEVIGRKVPNAEVRTEDVCP